jgi:hypothetical protein
MENGALTMIEEGLSYPTDILESGPNVLRLRSHNPVNQWRSRSSRRRPAAELES